MDQNLKKLLTKLLRNMIFILKESRPLSMDLSTNTTQLIRLKMMLLMISLECLELDIEVMLPEDHPELSYLDLQDQEDLPRQAKLQDNTV